MGVRKKKGKAPTAGWHYVFCRDCGEKYAKATHYGGIRKIKCSVCKAFWCLDCYAKKHWGMGENSSHEK